MSQGSASLQNRLEALYREHRDALYRYLLSLLREEEPALDCVQAAFTRLVRRPELLSELSSPRAYLFRVARNLAIDHMRVAKRHSLSERPLDEFLLLRPSRAEPPYDVERINQALQRLPWVQQEAVLLKVYQGLTFREIGEVQGVSQKTSESRYATGLKRLAQDLEGPRREWTS